MERALLPPPATHTHNGVEVILMLCVSFLSFYSCMYFMYLLHALILCGFYFLPHNLANRLKLEDTLWSPFLKMAAEACLPRQPSLPE